MTVPLEQKLVEVEVVLKMEMQEQGEFLLMEVTVEMR